jgi:hypothetical protein
MRFGIYGTMRFKYEDLCKNQRKVEDSVEEGLLIANGGTETFCFRSVR